MKLLSEKNFEWIMGLNLDIGQFYSIDNVNKFKVQIVSGLGRPSIRKYIIP